MTISSATSEATFLGNGIATAFSLPFRFFANSDIIAQLIEDSTGTISNLALGTDYSLTGAGEPEVAGNATGVLTTTSPVAVGFSLFVRREIPLTQPTDIVNQGSFFPETHETVFDRLTMQVQQAVISLGKALRVQPSEPAPAFLPPIASRADRLLSFDSNGNPISVAPAGGSAAALAVDLANSADPTKGAGQVGWTRSPISSVISTVHQALDVQEFSLWEFADQIVSKPNPSDFKTWDWAPAVQAAINAPSAGAQHIIKVPRGIRIATTVTVNNGVKFVGAEPFDYAYANFFTEDSALVMFRIRANYVIFDNVFLEGPGKVGTGTAIEVGDGTTNQDKFAFTNDSFVFNFNIGIDIKSQNWRVDKGAGASTCAVGFKLTGLPSTANNRNGYFVNANLHSCDIGIQMTAQWQALGIIGCDFNTTVLGISGTLVRSVIADNVFFNGPGTDIQITAGQNVAITGNAHNGNTTTANAGHGISLAGTHHSVSGNVITNKGGNGILAACSTSSICGNTVMDADFFDTTTYSGIKSTGNGNAITGNVSRTSSGGASRQTYGVELTGSSNLVSSNYVAGNKTAGILPGSGNKIFGNSGYVTESKGTASIGPASTSVTVAHGLSYTPTAADVSVTPTTDLGSASKFWMSNFTSTNFQINVNAVPSSLTVFFGWKAS